MKVVAFNGSPRKDGNTQQLLREVLGVVEAEGIDTELVQLGGRAIRGCIACHKCFENKDRRCILDDGLNDDLARMFDADGILIGSPTYFADVSTEVKALIDRGGFVAMANGRLLNRKVGAAVVAVRRAGAVHVFDSINHFFGINGMVIPGSTYWNLAIGLAPGDVAGDAEGIKTMRTLGENMAWLLKRLADRPAAS